MQGEQSRRLNPNSFANIWVLHHAQSGPASFTGPGPMTLFFRLPASVTTRQQCVASVPIQVGSTCDTHDWSWLLSLSTWQQHIPNPLLVHRLTLLLTTPYSHRWHYQCLNLAIMIIIIMIIMLSVILLWLFVIITTTRARVTHLMHIYDIYTHIYVYIYI